MESYTIIYNLCHNRIYDGARRKQLDARENARSKKLTMVKRSHAAATVSCPDPDGPEASVGQSQGSPSRIRDVDCLKTA